jgi:hypothetical protein
VLEPAVTEELRAVSLVATTLELTVNAPLEPAVCEISESVDPPSLVTTLAVTPMSAELIALATPEIVL